MGAMLTALWTDPLVLLDSNAPIPFDLFVTRKVNQLSTEFERQWMRFMRDKANVSLSEWRILTVLDARGALSSARIVEATGINKALCSRSIRHLEGAHLIETRATVGDARSNTSKLTPDGLRLVEEVRPHAMQRQRLLLEALTASERRTFYAVTDKLRVAAARWEPGPGTGSRVGGRVRN